MFYKMKSQLYYLGEAKDTLVACDRKFVRLFVYYLGEAKVTLVTCDRKFVCLFICLSVDPVEAAVLQQTTPNFACGLGRVVSRH